MFLIEFQPHLTCKCVWCFLLQTTADLAIFIMEWPNLKELQSRRFSVYKSMLSISIVFILELKIMHVISQCSNANICFCFINIYKYLINLEAPFSEEKNVWTEKNLFNSLSGWPFFCFSLKQQQFKHLEKQFKVLIFGINKCFN